MLFYNKSEQVDGDFIAIKDRALQDCMFYLHRICPIGQIDSLNGQEFYELFETNEDNLDIVNDYISVTNENDSREDRFYSYFEHYKTLDVVSENTYEYGNYVTIVG